MYVRLHSVTVAEGARVVGQSIDSLDLHAVGAEVTTIRRGKGRVDVAPQTLLAQGDVVVLRGGAEAVSRAEERLLQRN